MVTSLHQAVLLVAFLTAVEEHVTHGDAVKQGNGNTAVQQTQDLTSLSKLLAREPYQ